MRSTFKIAERLVQRNFVNRSDHPQSRRRVVLSLTEAGLEHLQQCRAQTRDRIAFLFNNLAEEQILLIEQGLTLLQQVFDENSIEPPKQ